MKLYRKILELVIWALMIAYLIVVLGFFEDKESEIRCKSIDVQIVDNTDNESFLVELSHSEKRNNFSDRY